MHRPGGQSRAGLGHPERQQQTRAVAGGRRLVERAAQICGRRLGGASARRCVRGFHELLHGPRVFRRLAREQVLGYPLVRSGPLGQQPRRSPVSASALARRELAVYPGSDDRVNKGERTGGFEDGGGGEHFGRRSCFILVELGQTRGLPELTALEDRQRSSQTPRGVW